MIVTSANVANIYGVGVRLLQDIDEAYGYSNDVIESIKNNLTFVVPSGN